LRAAIHQPQYFPYPGFFHKLKLADVFVIMDNVQYDKRFTNRNKILNPQGPLELTIPINKAHKFAPNSAVEINNKIQWRQEHWKKIELSYSKSPFYRLYRDYLKQLYEREWSLLFEIDLETIRKTMEWLGIGIPIVKGSELAVEGNSTEWLIGACKKVGADTYVSGIGGRSYLNESLFEKSGVKLLYQAYSATPYPQRFSETFVPNLSILDMLANVGPDSSGLIERAGGTEEPTMGPPGRSELDAGGRGSEEESD
jgi:hypothetical protein